MNDRPSLENIGDEVTARDITTPMTINNEVNTKIYKIVKNAFPVFIVFYTVFRSFKPSNPIIATSGGRGSYPTTMFSFF